MSARLLVLVAIAGLTGACSREAEVRCGTGIRYLDSGSADLLRVPDDLDLPEETEALVVPGPTPPRTNDADGRECLEYSPGLIVADGEDDAEDD